MYQEKNIEKVQVATKKLTIFCDNSLNWIDMVIAFTECQSSAITHLKLETLIPGFRIQKSIFYIKKIFYTNKKILICIKFFSI